MPDVGFTIDQVIIDNNLSTINDQGYTFYNINDHHTIEVTFQYNGQKPPEQVSVMNQTNGVIIQWNDKTITNEVSSYRIYRSPFFNGPFIEIDPIYINKVFVDGNPFYRVFDSFDATEILRKESYFYGISAIMPDGNITKISEPVEGIPTLTESGRIRLIPIQQELETIPGKNVMFNIYVVAVGNFQEWVELSVSYPDSQYIPDNVSYTFSETKVKPLALVKLEVNIGVEAIPETFDIDLHGSGGDRSDTIRLRCSVVQADENSSFISTHIKQKKVRLDEQIDLNGHISIRKNDSIDIFGTIIPRGTYPVEILIQTDQLIPEKLSVDSNSEGKFETSYRPDHVGHHTIKAQYKNSHDEMTKSQPIIISVRKSNKSKILCDTGVQSIETGKTIKLYSHLIPRLENIPIHFQITKPDNSVNTSQFKTDDQGEVFFNITLSQTGIWKILAWWEGNQSYEGKFSTPLYLYPGIETPRALIIAGGGNQNNTLSVSTQYLAERFYKLLINRRLNNDLIYYVSSVSEELNGRLDENLPTEQKISDFIKSLYNEGPPYQVNDDIPLLIYMVDHGGRNLFQIDTDEYLRANFLDQQLDILQEKTRCEVQMIIESCYSGSFLDDLAQSGSQKRIIITSTGDNNPSYMDQDGRESFSNHLFNALFQGNSLGQSFSLAKFSLFEKPYLYQDQIPEINTIELANNTNLGGRFVRCDYMPNIIEHTPNQSIDESVLTIKATIIDIEDSNCTVWASILPPNFQSPTFGEFNTPQWHLERLDLNPVSDQEYVYTGTYSCFYQKGFYVITIYASDSVGNMDSEEIYIEVKQDLMPQDWGDVDGNTIIDLEDAIIALKMMSGISIENNRKDNCRYTVGLEEILFILQVMADVY